jgi:hypothetical protein
MRLLTDEKANREAENLRDKLLDLVLRGEYIKAKDVYEQLKKVISASTDPNKLRVLATLDKIAERITKK